MSDLYDTTLLATRIPGLPQVRISTSVLEMATGRRHLHAEMLLVLQSSDNGISSEITVPLDPGTMRAMARVLTEHATRISVELLPLVANARPDPEAAAIYRALEADHVG
jgi:hypothetical protein